MQTQQNLTIRARNNAAGYIVSRKMGVGREFVEVRVPVAKTEKPAVSADQMVRMNARVKRDEAIRRIHELSYSRNHRLVPRKTEYREELSRVSQAAKVYAYMARPEFGYPKPPTREIDPEFPALDTRGMSYHEAERDRLRAWLVVLATRCDDLETEFTMIRVEEHVDWLSRQIEKAQARMVAKNTRRIESNGRLVIVERAR